MDDDITKLVAKFSKETLVQFLRYIREWNTVATHSMLAQKLLHIVFTKFTPLELAAVPGMEEVCCNASG